MFSSFLLQCVNPQMQCVVDDPGISTACPFIMYYTASTSLVTSVNAYNGPIIFEFYHFPDWSVPLKVSLFLFNITHCLYGFPYWSGKMINLITKIPYNISLSLSLSLTLSHSLSLSFSLSHSLSVSLSLSHSLPLSSLSLTLSLSHSLSLSHI